MDSYFCLDQPLFFCHVMLYEMMALVKVFMKLWQVTVWKEVCSKTKRGCLYVMQGQQFCMEVKHGV